MFTDKLNKYVKLDVTEKLEKIKRYTVFNSKQYVHYIFLVSL